MFRLRSCTVRQRFDRCLQGVARTGLCCTLLLAASACLFACPKTDDEVRRVAGLNGIPEADAEFLIARIAEVEKSQRAIVSCDGMSKWRRDRLLAAVEDWARSFPGPEGRTEATTRGHTWGIMQMIAPLFVVPPRHTPPDAALVIDSQLREFRELVSEALGTRIRAYVAEACTSTDGQSPGLSSDDIDILTESVIDDVLMSAALPKDDDVSPGPRIPLPSAVFSETKRRVQAAAEAFHPTRTIPIHGEIAESLIAARAAGDDLEVARLIGGLRIELITHMAFGWRSNDLPQAILAKAYGDTIPPAVAAEFREHTKVLESMIDTVAIKTGIDELLALDKASQDRWVEERRRDFAEVVARQPQSQSQPSSIGSPDHRRLMFVAVNAAIVALLAAVVWWRRRKLPG